MLAIEYFILAFCRFLNPFPVVSGSQRMVRLAQGTYPSRHLEGLDQEPGYLLRVGSGYPGELMSECCVEFMG